MRTMAQKGLMRMMMIMQNIFFLFVGINLDTKPDDILNLSAIF